MQEIPEAGLVPLLIPFPCLFEERIGVDGAPIDDKLAKKLQDIAICAYKSVDCRDFGRVDFRMDKEGNPYVLEINPLPNLSPDDVFVLFGNELGLTYNQIINKILDEALVRTGLLQREEAYKK